jgi:hypothetical protein
MMGLNASTQGIFSSTDVNFAESFNTVEERNDATIVVIKERLNNFGILGYAEFLSKKALVNFADGSFAWSREGNFYYRIIERTGKEALFLRNFYYLSGKYYKVFITGIQILWIIVLLLLTGMGFLFNRPDTNSVAVIVTIIGIYCYVMLFEARSRYLFTYSPFLIMGAGLGLNLGVNALKHRIALIKMKGKLGFRVTRL